MKNRIFKSILVLLLIFVAMPVMGQDYMNIFFKDGSHLKFFMPSLKELYVSSYDSEGYFQSDYKYQYLVTNSGKYVYDLSDIDYITYTKCDEEEVEQNIVNSVSTIIPILEECSSITEVEKRLDDVKMAEGIEDAWSDGSQLCVKIKDWGTMAFHFHDESYDDDDDAWEAKVMKKMASLRPIIKKAVANGKTLKVAIANQTKNNDMPSFTKIEKRFQKIISLFESLGINPVPVDPTIDFFRTGMYEYDFVVLCTHGSIMTDNKGRLWYDEFGDPVHFMFTSDYLGAISKTYFSTNEPSNEELKEPIRQLKTLLKQKGLEDYFSNDEIRVDWIEELRGFGDYWIAYPLVTENFIRDASESQFSNPNSILFAAVCHSLEGKSSLANKLQDKKNLGSYLGYDGEIDTGKGSNAALSFIMSLLSGYSIKKSEENIPDEYKIDTSFRKNTKLVPELSNNGQDFLFPTVTKQIDQTTAQNAFNSFGYVEVEGNTTCIDPNADDVVKMGFQYSTNENFSPASSVVSSDVIKLTKPLDNGNGNVQFRAQLTGLQPGNTYFYRAYTYDGLNYNYGEPCPLEIEQGGEIMLSCPDSHHPHMIDLGLPSGTKWACCNVGASKPEEYGGYYAWGETTEKSYYDWDTYTHCDGSWETCHNIGKDIAGTQYDAATANWGSPWVMPNKEQMEELKNNCTSEWTTENGVNGRRFTASNGASIFLPAAGERWEDDLGHAGSYGDYWSSTLNESITRDAWYLEFYSGRRVSTYDNGRHDGRSVRPVVSDAPVYPDLQVSQTQVNIDKGSSTTVEITSGSGEYGVTNLNSSIAKATLQGTTITISALLEGYAKVVATDMQTGQKIIIEITVTIGGDIVAYTSCPDSHHPHLIDLGLPSGTKWACCNVGASKPEEYGGYYAWGETTEKSRYNWDTYIHCDGSSSTCHDIGKDISGTQYDAATVNWGSPWVMPNKEQMEELKNNCTSEWTTENGVYGRRFTGPYGASIFLPATGYRWGDVLNDAGSRGNYRSSTLNESSTSNAWLLYFYSGGVYAGGSNRKDGRSVRPVRK